MPGNLDRVRAALRSRRDPSAPSLWGLVKPYLRGERHRLTIVGITAIFGGLCEALLLILIAKTAVDVASQKSSIAVPLGPFGDLNPSVGQVVAFGAALIVVWSALRAVGAVQGARASANIIATVRRRLIHQYLAATWALQSTQREGRLQEVLTTYAGATSATVSSIIFLVVSMLSLTVLLVVALIANPAASLAAALTALAVGLMLRPLRAAVRRRSARAAASQLEFATGLTELASTMQEVRIFRVEDKVGARLNDLTDRTALAWLRTSYVSASIGIIYQGVAMLVVVGALGVAYSLDVSGTGSVGAVVLIMLRSLGYAQAVQANIQSMYESAPYLETLQEEEATYLAAAQPRGTRPVEHVGELVFDNVSFEYEPGIPVLQNVSFGVKPGEIIGIVGPSGSGKSTLVQLLLRLREPTTGAMLAGGVDARDLVIDDWYDLVSFVPQEPRLFAGTVADNIRFFRDVDAAAIERAAKLAHIHDDIASWPHGYDTFVGERGGQLSGGQRQRMCIARALVGEPEMVVFDEPTSALDVRSESLMRDTMQDLGSNKTVFIIAHRISTLSICNRIMVILGGAMEGFDAPETLEATNPFYREALRLSGLR